MDIDLFLMTESKLHILNYFISKDLLAWLGGALGIFVGYSFFDFAKQIIDVAFYCIYKKMGIH